MPSASVDLINDRDPSGPRKDGLSVSPSTGRRDYNLDGSRCLCDLFAGNSPEALRVQKGIAELRATGDLHGIPTLILHGREDARVPTNSRPAATSGSIRWWKRAGATCITSRSPTSTTSAGARRGTRRTSRWPTTRNRASISMRPVAADAISVSAGVVKIPD